MRRRSSGDVDFRRWSCRRWCWWWCLRCGCGGGRWSSWRWMVLRWTTFVCLLGGRALPWKLSNDWCLLDSGETVLTDQSGFSQTAYVSRTRDGSVWLRFGTDQSSTEWTYDRETLLPAQFSLLEASEVGALLSLNYTDFCVLTDLDLSVKADLAWHPSYITVFDPRYKDTRTMLFRHNRDCHMSTSLALGPHKQGLLCHGGKRNACGQRSLPERGRESPPVFLRNVNFDPLGPDHWRCGDDELQNSYSFKGSYYHVYVKMASCSPAKDSRLFGYDAVMRPEKDDSLRGVVLIPSPTSGSLEDCTVIGWQLFVQIISVRHSVFLQVWRPSIPRRPSSSDQLNLTLVGQTFLRPTELRYVEITLEPRQYLRIRRGDVLGLHFPDSNPIGWTAVPCAFRNQAYLTATASAAGRSSSGVSVGRTLRFDRAALSGQDDGAACRQYSFSAILANRSGARLIEDWTCPNARIGLSSETRLLTEPEQRGLEEPSFRDDGFLIPPQTQSSIRIQQDAINYYFKASEADAVFLNIFIVIVACFLLSFAILTVVGYFLAYK